MNKGFTEPESYGAPIIGDSENIDPNEGQTTYFASPNYQVPPAPRQNPMPLGATNAHVNSNGVYNNPNLYWNNGLLIDRTTGQAAYPAYNANASQVPVIDPSKPKSHLIQLPDRIIINLHVPGIKRDNINIDFDEPMLTISGIRTDPANGYIAKYDDKDKDKVSQQSDVYYGEFSVVYKMSKVIDDIDATMEDGVLIIVAKFKAKSEQKSISIK